MTSNTTQRPAGVTAAAIVLGLAAAVLLVLALVMVVGAAAAGHMPSPAASTGQPAPAPAMITAMAAFIACFYLSLAAWAIATLVGLFRMKIWARISVMVIGGCLVLLGLVSALGSLAMPMLMKSQPLQASPDPAKTQAVMHVIFFVMAALWLGVAAIGVWWLVYFALRSTREAFKLANASAMPAPAFDSLFGGPSYRPASTPAPLDFSVAQPLPPVAEPAESAKPWDEAPPPSDQP